MSIQLIQQAICYMEEHIYEAINYTDVAKYVSMSNYTFVDLMVYPQNGQNKKVRSFICLIPLQ